MMNHQMMEMRNGNFIVSRKFNSEGTSYKFFKLIKCHSEDDIRAYISDLEDTVINEDYLFDYVEVVDDDIVEF